MAIPGEPTTAAPGAADDMMTRFIVRDNGDGLGAYIEMQPAPGYGNRYWNIVVDGQRANTVYILEGETYSGTVSYDPSRSEHVVGFSDNGLWPEAYTDATVAQQAFGADKGKTVEFAWDAVIETLEAYGDDSQLSNWNLAGWVRNATGRGVNGRVSENELDVVLATDGGVHTLTLALGDSVLAQGSRTGDGPVTLAAVNSSGLSGTVELAYSADLALGDCILRARWAAQYEIHCAAALSFPRTPEKIVTDRGLANRLVVQLAGLAAGTYQYLIRAVSDTGISGANTTAGSIVVPGRPQAPGIPYYESGGYAATVIRFVKSSTAGATYRYYDSPLDGPTSFAAAVSASEVDHGDGTISATLPAIAAAAGVRRVCVAAVYGGAEDGGRRTVAIEYDAAGTVVLPRPNNPTAALQSIAGLILTASYAYNRAGEAGVGAAVQIELLDESGAVAASNTGILSLRGGIASGQIAATAPAAAWYRARLAILTAGGTPSLSPTVIGPFWLSDAAPAAPANVGATLEP